MKDSNIATEPTDLSRLRINWKDGASGSGSPRRPRKTIWIVGAVAAIVAAVVGYRFLFLSPLTVETARVVRVDPSQQTVVLNSSGYVVAQRQAAVASKGTGRLVELKVREGDKVKKGEVIARLESADVAAGLSRARANLGVADSNRDQAAADLNEATLIYERKQSLLESGLTSKADFDAAEARYRGAQAALASSEAAVRAAEAAIRAAEVEVENTTIRAPFDGTVLTKNAEVGEVVAPFGSATSAKAAVVTMADMDSLEVEADVSESNIEKVHVGQQCEIGLDAYPDIKYEGVVQTIVPTADRAKATVLTKIRFLNLDKRVLPEMSAKVSFLSAPVGKKETAPKLAVQPAAVVLRGDRRVVFRVDGNRADEVDVEVGEPIGGLVEIKNGLAAGDRVVLNPPETLRAKDRIKVDPSP